MRNLKTSALLLFITAALHFGILEGMESIEGNCNDVIRLPCKATDRTNNYRYIVWYKINTQGLKTAIIKKKNADITHYNNFTASLENKETLLLDSVTSSDSGVYECYLAANIGGRNDESTIRLNISECVYLSKFHPTTVVTSVPSPVVSELSVSWALIGFSLISVAKITLCIVSVGVLDWVISRRVQRKQKVRGIKTGTKSSWKN